MKAIQISYCFYPDPAGGTEVYVESLSKNLQRQGIDVVVAAPGEESKTYFYNKLKVRRFAVSDKPRLEQLYGGGDPVAAAEFARILEEENPDIVHFHAFTSANSLRAIIAAKRRNIKIFFTYHAPAVSCQRGTLMLNGKEACDGKLILHRCVRCTLQGMGMGRLSSAIISGLSPSLGGLLGKADIGGGVFTALRMSELVKHRHDAFYGLMRGADHIIALCDWAKMVLVRNGAPEAKITVIRQGVCYEVPAGARKIGEEDNAVRLAYLGRIHPTKGLHIIIKALKDISSPSIRLDIYGILQAEDKYYRRLLEITKNDPRVSFKKPLPAEEIIDTIRNYDFIVVPSQWLETGPMVILEAFTAGVAVIGSDLGGIAEIVKDGVNGILVRFDNVEAWTDTLNRCLNNRKLARELREGIVKPGTMDSVALGLKRLYSISLS